MNPQPPRLPADAWSTLAATATEAELLETVRKLASLYGWLCFHTHDSRRSEAGFPDLVLVRSPRVIFAELKRQGGRTAPAQVSWLCSLQQCPGVEVYLWRPGQIVEIAGILRRRDA